MCVAAPVQSFYCFCSFYEYLPPVIRMVKHAGDDFIFVGRPATSVSI